MIDRANIGRKLLAPFEIRECLPEIAQGSTADIATTANVNLKGGVYRLDDGIQFNNVVLRILSILGSSDGRLLLYQTTDGEAGAADHLVELVATVDFTVVGADLTLIAPVTEGTVELVPGLFLALWGIRSGAGFDAECYNIGNISLANVNVPAAATPTNFGTTVAASGAPAATFDPTIGGGVLAGSSTDWSPILRLMTV